jgi:hypothetical protein
MFAEWVIRAPDLLACDADGGDSVAVLLGPALFEMAFDLGETMASVEAA